MKSHQIRQSFLDYFAQKGHSIVPSSSLVPNDPSLLFTNAGMVQFKDYFIGRAQPPYPRAASVQRCVRAGGKHNDLENVGYTARHHTFFEMLGNFSFGDYFKREAIQYAWQFLTEVMNLPPEKMWITVYMDDQEAADIWLNEIGINPNRFSRIGDKPNGQPYESDNFWSMGDTGPCGPCSEIFYDHGPSVAGGPPGTPEEDGDRYIEIWNLVFMQYNRDANGLMTPLPKPSVDTGMGLERLAAIMQGVHSNYDIDLFQHLIQAAAEITQCSRQNHHSLRVLADHIRSCAFLVMDGVLPSNEGQGYVLRRIIRRAIRHGYQLGQKDPFFYALVDPLADEMGEAYPELIQQKERIKQVLKREEMRFAETIEHGMKLLQHHLADLKPGQFIDGQIVFKLYDTYGFPVDLTSDMAREKGLKIDMEGFEQAMQAQKERAKQASQFDQTPSLIIEGETDFCGYTKWQEQATVIGLFQKDQSVEQLSAGQSGIVVLDKTPFYAESGGQIGDQGQICNLEKSGCFMVENTLKQGGAITHIGHVKGGTLSIGDRVNAQLDPVHRQAVSLNHSATHLLHAALRQILGDHVHQKGSLVAASQLRFDFSHFEPLKPEQIQKIEYLVNAWIRHNDPVETRIMNIEDAKKMGAMALFGEKYGEQVRVLKMGDFSIELCGGTHVKALGDIGLFKIISETGVAGGIRRIEAITGETALLHVQNQDTQCQTMAALLKTQPDQLLNKIHQINQQLKEKERLIEQYKAKLAASAGSRLAEQSTEYQGIKILAARLEQADAKSLRQTLDQLKNKLGSAVIVLATVQNDKVQLVAGITPDLTDRLKAGDLIRFVAKQIGGKGGGRSDMAQGGGQQPQKLSQALQSVQNWVEQTLSSAQ